MVGLPCSTPAARDWTVGRLHALNRTVPVQVKFFAIPNDQDAVVLRNRRADEVVLVSAWPPREREIRSASMLIPNRPFGRSLKTAPPHVLLLCACAPYTVG